MDIAWAALLFLTLLVGWVMTLFSLPGNWVMVGAAALYWWLAPDASRAGLEWPWLAGLVVLAGLGELAELGARALGVAQGGGSKRGAALAVGGSVVGSIGLALLGIPIPVVGPLIAAVLGAALGALGGAMLGEAWKGRSLGQSWRIGQGAFWGRLLGTLAKVSVASAMVIAATLGMWL
jgi:uncharacterized protein YqgC (DUF456 family)